MTTVSNKNQLVSNDFLLQNQCNLITFQATQILVKPLLYKTIFLATCLAILLWHTLHMERPDTW